VEISSFDITYSFSLSLNEKFFPGPYWEHSEVNIKGRLLKPDNFKSREIIGTILGDRDLVTAVEDPEHCRHEPKGVGQINLRGKDSEFLVSIPHDALPLIYELLKDSRAKFIDLNGFLLYRGESWIRSISFDKEYSVEEEGSQER